MVNILCAVLLGPGYGLGAAFGGLCAYPIGIVISGVLIYTLKNRMFYIGCSKVLKVKGE